MSTTAKHDRAHIDDLHFEHEAWKRELDFYKDEYKFYQDKLEEVASRYTKTEVLKELEQFQNKIYLHRNAIDELVHDINQHEQILSQYAQEHPVAIDHVLFEGHGPLQEQVNTNRSIVTEFKKQYVAFLAKWM